MLILSVTLTYLVLTSHLIFLKNQAGSLGQHQLHVLKPVKKDSMAHSLTGSIQETNGHIA